MAGDHVGDASTGGRRGFGPSKIGEIHRGLGRTGTHATVLGRHAVGIGLVDGRDSSTGGVHGETVGVLRGDRACAKTVGSQSRVEIVRGGLLLQTLDENDILRRLWAFEGESSCRHDDLEKKRDDVGQKKNVVGGTGTGLAENASYGGGEMLVTSTS